MSKFQDPEYQWDKSVYGEVEELTPPTALSLLARLLTQQPMLMPTCGMIC
jgi:hypothetical protein